MTDPRDEAVYVISVAAELAGMHPQTLRAYERRGLLEPSRTDGNTRRYSRRDIERLRLIAHLTQEEGLNLAGVRMVLEMGRQLDQAQRRAAELERRLEALAERLRERAAAGPRGNYEVVPLERGELTPHPDYRGVRYIPRRGR